MRPSAIAEKSMPPPSQARPPVGPSKGPASFSNVQAIFFLPDRDARHVHARAEHRAVGGDVERAPVRVAPGHVGAVVRDADSAEELPVGTDHVNAAGTGAVDVAFAIDLHAVGDAGLASGELVKQALRPAAAVGPHVVGSDLAEPRVIYIEHGLIGREGK